MALEIGRLLEAEGLIVQALYLGGTHVPLHAAGRQALRLIGRRAGAIESFSICAQDNYEKLS